MKDNVDTFADFISENTKSASKSSLFPTYLKSVDVTPLQKRMCKEPKRKL